MNKAMQKFGLFICGLIAVATVSLFSNAVQAQQPALTPEHIIKIKQNCVSAQVSMQRVQKIDAVSRTLRGREYEDVYRLMLAFNNRVVINKLTVPGITDIAANLSKLSKNEFFNHYTAYANAMDKALRIDCVKQPVEFYSQLNAVRLARQQLKSDVDIMAQQIANYDKTITDLKATLMGTQAPESVTQ